MDPTSPLTDDKPDPGDTTGVQGATRNIRGPSASDQAKKPDEPDDPMRMPFEHDQSSDASAEQPHEKMRQAKRDLDAGLVDTDLRNTPGQDAERQRELLAREKARSGGSGSKP